MTFNAESLNLVGQIREREKEEGADMQTEAHSEIF